MPLRISSLLSEVWGEELIMSKISKGWVTLILGPATGLWIILQHPDEINTIIGATVVIIQTITALYHDIMEKQIKATATKVVSTPENTTLVLPKGATAVPTSTQEVQSSLG